MLARFDGRKLGIGIAAVCVMAVSGCAKGTEKLLQRVESPDGSRVAVLMKCQDPANRAVVMLSGAVYDTAERPRFDCDRLSIDPLASFVVSNSPDPDEPAPVITWEGTNAVFEIGGDRRIVRRENRSSAPLDLIRLKGSFDGADIEVD